MSQIKHCFTSRFKDGYIAEVDWNQLEVVILQVESQDTVLRQELQDGLDLHTAMTSVVYNTPYTTIKEEITAGNKDWIAKRKKVKSGRFALQYGASAKKIAATTGWSESEARDFVEVYYRRYPGIKAWQKMVKAEVKRSALPIDGVWKGQYISPNGRRYVFTGEWNAAYNMVSFPPTKLQNYPIQGLASDFVKRMRHLLIKDLIRADLLHEIVPVNTIHDSVMFDCLDLKAFNKLEAIIKNVYGRAQKDLYLMCNSLRKVDVPLNYSIKYGTYWS